MPITRTAWIDDDGSGTVGSIINNAEKTILYNQIDAAIGTKHTGTFAVNPADFTANNGGAWTVTSGQICWAFNPTLSVMFIAVQILASTITGAPTNLFMAIPAGRQAAAAAIGSTYINHPAAFYEIGMVLAALNDTKCALHRPGIGAFGAGACNGYFTLTIPLV